MNVTSIRTTRTTRRLLATGVVAMALLAACGGDDDDTTASSAAGAAPATAPATAAPATAAPAGDDGGDPYYPVATEQPAAPAAAPSGATTVATAETDLGTILVDAEGMTLYAFTEDVDGKPTCVEGCADAWPPALVDGEPSVGDLEASVFAVVEHPQGTQLKAGDFPLYTFAGDANPGDTSGQGSGGVWFVVAADGTLIR